MRGGDSACQDQAGLDVQGRSLRGRHDAEEVAGRYPIDFRSWPNAKTLGNRLGDRRSNDALFAAGTEVAKYLVPPPRDD